MKELAHTAPGMMLQFASAGLLTAAQVIVAERKSRTLQRLLTTSARRNHILMGHYLAILFMIAIQFFILIVFAQLALKVDYLRVPDGTAFVAASAALCIAALGLLIGVFANTEEQAITFSLIPMFVFAWLGGAWVPLEVTGPVFQAIGHLTPIARPWTGSRITLPAGWGFNRCFFQLPPCLDMPLFSFFWRYGGSGRRSIKLSMWTGEKPSTG